MRIGHAPFGHQTVHQNVNLEGWLHPGHFRQASPRMDDAVSWFLQIPPNPRRTSSSSSSSSAFSRLSSLVSSGSSTRTVSKFSSLYRRFSVRPSGPDDKPRHKPSQTVSRRGNTHVEVWRQPPRTVSWSAEVVIPARERMPDDYDPRSKSNPRERFPDDCGPQGLLPTRDRAPDDCDPRIESIFDECSISFSYEDDTPWSARAARGGRDLDIKNSPPLRGLASACEW